MWQVVNPVYWWAAGALLLPIVIHLYNQRSAKVKQLGTLRWLKEIQPAQANFRRIQQWPLLLVRLLLFFCVVLLLVQLYYNSRHPEPEKKLHTLILIHPQAGDTVQLRQLGEGMRNDSVQVRWLGSNFPSTDQPAPADSSSVWSLLADAVGQFPADSIHFIAPNRADYFVGKQPVLASALSWELTDWKKDTTRLLQVAGNEKEAELLWFRSGKTLTETVWQSSKSNVPSLQWQPQAVTVTSGRNTYQVPIQNPDTLMIAAQYDATQQDEWKLLQAALQALGTYHRVPMRFTQNAQQANWIVSLNQKPPRVDSASLFIGYQPVSTAAWLEPAKTDSLILRKKLTTQHILDGGLMQELRPYVLAFKSGKATVPNIDYRKVDVLKAPKGTPTIAAVHTAHIPPKDATRMWLGIITLILVALERLWPKQTL